MDWICYVDEHMFSEELYYAVTINASRLQHDHKSSLDYGFELFNKSDRGGGWGKGWNYSSLQVTMFQGNSPPQKNNS